MNRGFKKIIVSVCAVFLTAAFVQQDKASSLLSLQSQTVKFDGHGVQLAGTLVVPKLDAGKRAPGILIVTGASHTLSEIATPDAGKASLFRDLAQHLAGRGFAVLSYDKRCRGESECKPPATFDDYIDDARKAMEFLKKQPQVDPAKVFFFGHDEGGYIASSLAAFEEAKCSGLILAAMSGRTLGKIVREQVQNRLTAAGKPSADISTYMAKFDRIIKGLASGRSVYSDETFDSKDPHDVLLQDLIKRREIIVSLLINDPLQIVNGVQAPVLVLQGRKDNQMSVKDAQYLDEALKRASHPDATLQLLDEADHLLRSGKAAGGIDPAALTSLTEWLQKRAK
ncbi:MAG TPA: alpha/beta fold hydrolase [Blastocatellia bacterium]|nr:alpha/beta fold hydrolase [Blastocatellia bacterium]HMX28309.1 alpha/beta fold hydrolase [Blastocatellia bacterium]HMZ21907.1 alpha/beta fold hydrolase [Blastocatellia bacterium]HNG30717.1 alpha/beta fold hydrolase [Blastocatellia bacterium]